MRALVIVALLASTAAAEPTLELRIEGDDVVASVVGIPKVDPLTLYDPYVDGVDNVVPRSVRGYFDETVAIAFVVSGQDHRQLAEAFERLALGDTVVDGSEALVISYANEPAITMPWSRATHISGKSLGAPTAAGSKLMAGVELAYKELATRSQRHKLMIVVGDGHDENDQTAIAALSELGQRHSDVTVISLQQPSDAAGNVLDALTLHVVPAISDDLDAALEHALHLAGSRFEARFELAKLPRDGKRHTLVLMHDIEQIASAQLELPSPPKPPPPSKTWRWLVLLGVIAAFCGVSFVMFRSK
jgi:hypothetical protein